MSLDRRTLLKSLPAGLVAPHLAPLVARAEAAAAGRKPMRFVFVLEGNGMLAQHVIPKGFKRPEMKSPKPNYEFLISGSDEIIDMPLGGPDGQLPDALDPLARHLDRVTLLTGLSSRVTSPSHVAGHGALGCYPLWSGPKDITIDAALGKAHPSIRPLVSLGWYANGAPQTVPPMFDGHSALGPNQKVSVLQDPVLAHQVLFGKIVGGDTRAEVGSQSLVLDQISRTIHTLKPQLPAEEGRKLEEVADAFSSIARRQARLEEIDPAKIPPLRPDLLKGPISGTKRLTAHFEHAATALITGLTNVVTLCAGVGHPFWNDLEGVTEDTHVLGHKPHDPVALAERAKIRQFNAGLIAKLVDTLEAVPEGAGTMMDNTLIVFLSEGAEGHHCTAMEWPMVLVGSLGGRLQAGGRYLNVPKYGGKGHATVAQFFTALLHAAGAPVDHFGMKDRSLVEAGIDQRGPWEHILA